jgi:rare lipoprotein A
MRSSLTLLLLVALLAGCSARRSTKQIIPRIGHHETGIASWYGDPYHGRHAANGEVYDMEKLTAAHRTYAFDTWLRVVNLSNDKSVVVRITDRGPFVDHRIIDLSRAAARDIDMLRAGTTKVRLEVIPAPKGREYEAIHNKTNAKDVETARAARPRPRRIVRKQTPKRRQRARRPASRQITALAILPAASHQTTPPHPSTTQPMTNAHHKSSHPRDASLFRPVLSEQKPMHKR